MCTDFSKTTEAECQGEYFEYIDSGKYYRHQGFKVNHDLKRRGVPWSSG